MRWGARGALLGGVAVALCAVSAPAQETNPDSAEAAAVRSANAWLEIVDDGLYSQSWVEAASAFRDALPEAQWVSTMQQVRAPLGSPGSRELAGVRYTTEIPNAPPGEYVIVQFRTQFSGREEAAIETVVPMKERDGSWKVSGYFIR